MMYFKIVINSIIRQLKKLSVLLWKNQEMLRLSQVVFYYALVTNGVKCHESDSTFDTWLLVAFGSHPLIPFPLL